MINQNTKTVLRRSYIVLFAVALAATALVYSIHDWFDYQLIGRLGLGHTAADAVCTFVIILLAFIGQRLVSLVLFRDMEVGSITANQELQDRIKRINGAAQDVVSELNQVHVFNDVVRGQMNMIIEETEKAAFDITERLQTIDEVVTRLNSFVDSISRESSDLLSRSEVVSYTTRS